MDITIKNVSPDMAKAIELLASKADVGWGPQIEVEVHEDAPKKYEPLEELKLGTCSVDLIETPCRAIGASNKAGWIALFPNYAENNAAELVHKFNIGMRAIKLLRRFSEEVKKGGVIDLSPGQWGNVGTWNDTMNKILTDLDAGLRE